MSSIILTKIALGMSLSAPFGPLSAEGLQRGLQGGFWSALMVRLGGAVGNLLCLVSAYLFFSLLASAANISIYSGAIGSLILIYLGLKQFMQKIKIHENVTTTEVSSNLAAGFVLSLANPMGIVWWLSVYASSEATNLAATQMSFANFAPNLFILVGVLLWALIFSTIVAGLHKSLPISIITLISRVSSLALVAFGIKYAITAYNLATAG